MKILFQGDSITDTGRNRDSATDLGRGYAQLVGAALGFSEPGKYEFINKGIGGNRVVDVYARINTDIINLAPDVMSILVGVNDIWQYYAPSPNGTPAEKYYTLYDMLISEVKAALPNVKIMILEPFVLRGSGTYMFGSGGGHERYDEFRGRVEELAQMARKIAQKHQLLFVPLQKGFDALTEQAEDAYWLSDGVHPTLNGHEYLKQQWLKAFTKLTGQENAYESD